MKLPWIPVLLLLGASLAGCVSPGGELTDNQARLEDAPDSTFHRDLPDTITGLLPVAATDVPTGAGIWIHGNYAYVSGLNSGFHVVDVSDPENPNVVGSLTDDFFSRDVDLLTYEDGRLVAVAASQGGGMNFINVTDPTAPRLLANVETAAIDSPTHNVAVLPGTHLVYNSASGGRGGDIDVIDAADPENPEIVTSWGTAGCHDITFHVSDDKQRAYCAGIQETQIWDIADPLDGKLVAAITNPFVHQTGSLPVSPPVGVNTGLHHLAMVNEDASLLIVGDEFRGGSGPGCGAHTPADDSPLGALWFYDLSDEANPQHLGHFAPDVPAESYAGDPNTVSCTSHFGQLVPGHDLLAMSWYAAGVLLIDFTDPTEPMLVDQWNPGTNTWDVRYHNGYLLTGDMKRGLDILTFE